MSKKIIEHPDHYTYGKVECWDWYQSAMTDEEFRGAMKNNVWKYTFRAGHKDPEKTIEDLEKAIAYLKRWIKFEQGARYYVRLGDEWEEIETSPLPKRYSILKTSSPPGRLRRFYKSLLRLLHIGE